MKWSHLKDGFWGICNDRSNVYSLNETGSKWTIKHGEFFSFDTFLPTMKLEDLLKEMIVNNSFEFL